MAWEGVEHADEHGGWDWQISLFPFVLSSYAGGLLSWDVAPP